LTLPEQFGRMAANTAPPGFQMTPDERARMNDLCVQIQNEKNYQKFEELMREVTTLMSAKESRFPESKFAPAGTGQRVMGAIAVRTMKNPIPGDVETIEIRLTAAEPLYSEIRIANIFTDEHGNALALQTPGPLDVKLQAPANRFSMRSSGKTT